MNISKQEARESLDQIQSVIDQTRKAIAYSGASSMLVLWGLIWVIGFSSSQFFLRWTGFVWMGLIICGSIGSWILGARQHPAFSRSSNHRRIGIFWLTLFAYAVLWLLLLHPTQLPAGAEWVHYQPINDRQVCAFFTTVPMFAYVVGGLWLGRFFVWLGALVTVLTLLGFYFLPTWFYLWMALTGGGSLLVAGLYIRTRWK